MDNDGGDIAAALIGGASGGDASAGGGGDAAAAAANGGDSADAAAIAAAAAAAGGGAAEPDWLTGISAAADGEGGSNRDWLKAKGFKDLDAVVKSYRGAEREITTLKQTGGGLKVPDDNATPEERAAFNKAIGVPDDPKGYEIKPPEGIELNTPLIDRLAAAAHKNGTPKAAFEATVADYVQAQIDEDVAGRAEQDQKAQAKLAEWGPAKDANLAAVNTAMRSLGLNGKDATALRGALGADRALDLMAKIGNGMSEDTLVTGGTGRFGITAAEARTELQKQNTEPGMMAKLMVKNSPEAIRRERLLAVVAADDERQRNVA